MYNNLTLDDIKTLINKLMAFIVLDGKKFVDEKDKELYVKSYINLFVNMINEPETKNNSSAKSLIMEQIFSDLIKYID